MLKMIKKYISLLLVAAMILGIVCVPGILPSATAVETMPVNLLTNPGFETRKAIPGWNTSPNPATYAELSSDYAKNGSLSLQVTGNSKWVWSDKITGITAGTAYVMTADVLADPDVDGKAIIQAIVRFYKDNDTVLSQTTAVTLDLTDTKGVWKTVTVTAPAPDGATKADVLLATTSASVGTVFYDNVSFMKRPALTEDLTIYSENFDTMQTMSVSSASAAVAGNWYSGNRSDVTYTVDTSSKDGSTGASLKFDKTTNAGTRTIQVAIAYPVLAGKTYRAELQYAGTVSNQFYLQSYGTVNGSMKNSASVASSSIVTDGSWNKQTVTLTATQDTNYLVIIIGIGGTATGTVNFDSIKLVEVADGTDDPSVVLEDNFDDLIINSDGSPANWSVLKDSSTKLPTAKYDKENSIVMSGSSLKVVKTALGTSGSYYITRDFSNVTLEVGKTYRMEIDYCGTLNPSAMNIMFWNTAAVGGNGTIVLQKALSAPSDEEWTHYEYEFTVGEGEAGANAATVRMGVDLRNSSAGTMYFDNMKLIDVEAEASKETEGNRLTNASFESSVSVDGWSNPAGTDALPYTLQSAEQAKDGSYSLKIMDKNTAGGYQFISTALDATAGEKYTATAEVYGSGTVQLVLRFLKTDGKMATQVFENATATTDWTSITVTGAVPDDATQVCVLLVTTGASTGTAYFDNISLIKEKEEEKEENTGSDTTGNTVIFSDDFEDSTIESGRPSGWNGPTDGNVTYTLETNVEGLTGNTLKQVKIGSSTRYLYVDVKNHPVVVGKTYRAEMDVFVVANATDTDIGKSFQFYLQTYTEGYGATVDSKDVGSNATEGKWVHLTNEITATANAPILRILFGLGGSAEGTIYVDNITVVEVAGSGSDTGGSGITPVDPSAIVDETFNDTSINANGVPLGWQGTVDANVTYTLDNSVRMGDNGYSLKLYKVDGTTSTKIIYIEKTFTVTAGKTYRAELDYYGTATCQFYLQTYNGSTLMDSQNAGTIGTSGQWTHLTNEFVATEGATKIRITIGLGGNICGTVYFDNIKLVETETQQEKEEIDPNVLLQDKFNNTAIEENGLPTNWTGNTTGGKYTLEDGNIYLQMTKGEGVTTSRTIYREWTVEIKAGQRFRLEMDYYGGPNCQFYLQLLSGGKVVQSQDKGKLGKENAWIHLTNEFTATQDAEKIRITIGLGGSVTGTVGFDNIRLVEVSDDAEQEIYTENFETAALQADTIPKGWSCATQKDIRFKLIDTGSYVQITKDKATEDPTTMVIEAPLEITAGTTYQAMIDFLGNARGVIQIELMNGEKVIQSTRKSALGSADLWGGLLAEITAESDADMVRITISLDASAVGSFGFDNFRFVRVEPLDLENMVTEIQNPSFEVTPSDNDFLPGWSTQSEAKYFTITDEQASDGKYSLKITDDMEDAGNNITSSRIEVIPNASYVATVDVYGDANAQLYIRFLNKYGVTLSNGSASAQKEDGYWYTLKAQTTAPADAVYAVIVLATTKQSTGRVYFDNVTITVTQSNSSEGGSTPDEAPTAGWNIVESGHPRLYFTSETLKDVKAFASDKSINLFGYSGAETYEDLIKAADAYVNETVYKVNYVETWLVEFDLVNLPDPNYMEELQTVPPAFGGLYYPYLTNYGTAIQLRMQTLALAYSLTGDTKYSDRAINYAMKMCKWELWAEKGYTIEGMGVNSCLETAYFVIGAATVYDMCYDQLTTAQRNTLKTNIMTKGLDMIYEDTEILVNHNYYLTRIGALITGACAVAESADEVEAYLTRGYNYAKWYLDNLYASGDQEGFLYNSHQLEYLIESQDNLYRVTGNNDLLTHEYFTDLLVDWAIYFMAPGNGKLMPISDTNFSHYFFKTMSILNKELGNEKAGFYLYYAKMSSDPFEMLLYTSLDPKIADAEDLYQAVTHIEELGYGGLRSGWDADDIFLSLISNTSDMSHNHYDQNSIIFSTDGNILVSDPGYADSSGNAAGEFGKYHGHTTIFVDGKPQSVLGTGSLQTVMPSDFYGYLMGSAADAYGEDKNGSVVDKFDRHAILINHGDRPYIVVFDELEASKERLFTWNMYTGGWNALEIEGEAVEGVTSVKGNKVAISTSGGMLYAEFVAGEPLNISTYMHDGGGPNLQVDSDKAKETDFMTILTKNYGDSANDEYSFIPLLDDEDAVEYKTSSKDPVITKSVTVQSVPLYFFRGDKVGDYIKLPFVAEESGNFELILKTCTSYNYGIYKIYIDDKYVATYDGCAIKVEINYFSLGQMDIEAGEHVLKLELVGTSSLTDGMLISVASIIFSSGQSLGSSPIYAEKVYDTDDVLGARIFHTEYNSDIVLLNRGAGSFTAGGITSDAKQASVIGLMTDGYMEGYAATNATSMVFNGTTLLKASKPVSVAADFRGTAAFTVITETAQTVKLYAGDGILGATVDGKSVRITTESGMAAVALSAGTHTVVLTMTQTTKIEYLDNGTVITTTYDQSGNIIRQHTQNADGTELLVENGVVIIRVYIDEDTYLLVREELAEDGTLTTTYYDVTNKVDRIVIKYPDGSRTEIDYQSDGTIVTTKWSADGIAYEGIIQYEDGSVTKAEYKDDATVTTKYDVEGNVLSIVTICKDGSREEVVYNSDGSVVTTKYAKGGKMSSVYVLNADGTATLEEYLSDGGVRTTTYNADGKVTEKITTYKDGSYIRDGFEHKIISGDGQNYSGEGVLVFVSNDDIVNFKYVTINGEEIDPSWYMVEAGSIKITLTEELLRVLGSGTFTVGIVTTHGEATVTFTIGAGQMSLWLWITIVAVILAAGTMATIILVKKKKKKEEQDDPVNA